MTDVMTTRAEPALSTMWLGSIYQGKLFWKYSTMAVNGVEYFQPNQPIILMKLQA